MPVNSFMPRDLATQQTVHQRRFERMHCVMWVDALVPSILRVSEVSRKMERFINTNVLILFIITCEPRAYPCVDGAVCYCMYRVSNCPVCYAFNYRKIIVFAYNYMYYLANTSTCFPNLFMNNANILFCYFVFTNQE